jgi:hypothetical protein
MAVARERGVVGSLDVQWLIVKPRPNMGVGQDHSLKNYPVDKTTRPYKPMTMREEKDHFGLWRTKWMIGAMS